MVTNLCKHLSEKEIIHILNESCRAQQPGDTIWRVIDVCSYVCIYVWSVHYLYVHFVTYL